MLASQSIAERHFNNHLLLGANALSRPQRGILPGLRAKRIKTTESIDVRRDELPAVRLQGDGKGVPLSEFRGGDPEYAAQVAAETLRR